MSKLQYYCRPFVLFDPTNKDHRKWFSHFNEHRSWRHCPVRFIIEDNYGDVVTMIQRKLIQYYMDKEFKKKA